MGGAHRGHNYRGGRAILALDEDYPQELALIAAAVYASLVSAGLQEPHCAAAALDAAEAVRKHVGGGQMYISMGSRMLAARRRKAVLAYLADHPGDYRGASAEFGIAVNTVRRIELQGGKK